MSESDLMTGTDQPRAYKQYEVTPSTAWRQLICIEMGLLTEACKEAGVHIPQSIRIQVCGGQRCAIMRARVMQFGDPLSAEMFVRHNRLMLAELRHLGIRIADQMDDDVLLNRLGPASTIADFMIKLDTFDYYGTVCHTNQKIEDWPTKTLEFDGSVVVPEINRRFVPPDKDLRHGLEITVLLDRFRRGEKVTLRQLASVVMMQSSTVNQCYYVRFLLVRPKAYLSRETKRCNAKVKEGSDPYALPVQKPDKATITDFRILAEPKEVGQYMKEPTEVLGEVWIDTSSWATGMRFQKLDPQTGQIQYSHRHQFFLTRQERQENHTVQENIGVVTGLRAVLKHYNLRAPKGKLQVLRYGSDNTATVAAANRSSVNLSMSIPMAGVMIAARERGIVIMSTYISKERMDRTYCDYDGRKRSHNQQWMLNSEVLQEAVTLLGIRAPRAAWLDMMACRATRQCRRYYSRTAEPESAGVDVMRQPWKLAHKPILYCYPPAQMAGKIVQRLREEKTEMVLVIPLIAATEPYWADFREMVNAYAVIPHSLYSHTPPEGWEVKGEELTKLDSPPPWSLIIAHMWLPGWQHSASIIPNRRQTSLSPPTAMGVVHDSLVALGPISHIGTMAEVSAAKHLGAQRYAPI